MPTPQPMIVGGLVADGDGGEPRPGDVLLDGERIAAVEPPGSIPRDGRDVVDATGLVVAPGFIDTHSHADNAPLLDDPDTSKIRQGVTTEVVGNCGFSLAPCPPAARGELARLVERIFPPLPWSWRDWTELDAVLVDRGYVTNHAPLVGHGTLRAAAMGMADRVPTADELAVMCRELARALDSGVFGLSSGLVYPPGMFSDTAELVRLARVLGGQRIYATHMRGEGDALLTSIAEATTIGRDAGCRTHLSHLKWTGRHNWGRMPEALRQVEEAAVTVDVYPYVASSTFLASCLPPELLAGTDAEVLDRLTRPATRALLRAALHRTDWDNVAHGAGWDRILVATTASHAYEGRTLAAIADDAGIEPVDALLEVLVHERLQATTVIFEMDEDDMRAALTHPAAMVGSDSLPPGRGGRPHPRTYGTFPRFLGRYVRDERLLPLGEAVRRITSVPAATFGIPDRGRLHPGYAADLVAFDPAAIADDCDFLDPARTPAGIAWVLLAGHRVVEGGRFLGNRRGRRLTAS